MIGGVIAHSQGKKTVKGRQLPEHNSKLILELVGDNLKGRLNAKPLFDEIVRLVRQQQTPSNRLILQNIPLDGHFVRFLFDKININQYETYHPLNANQRNALENVQRGLGEYIGGHYFNVANPQGIDHENLLLMLEHFFTANAYFNNNPNNPQAIYENLDIAYGLANHQRDIHLDQNQRDHILALFAQNPLNTPQYIRYFQAANEIQNIFQAARVGGTAVAPEPNEDLNGEHEVFQDALANFEDEFFDTLTYFQENQTLPDPARAVNPTLLQGANLGSP